MDTKRVRALRKAFTEHLLPKLRKTWLMECAIQGMSKAEAEKEIAFQLTKELYDPTMMWPFFKELSQVSNNDLTVLTIDRTFHCELLLCHNRTNLLLTMPRREVGIAGQIVHAFCLKHLEEYRLNHIVQSEPTESEIRRLDLEKKLEKLEAKWWAENHKTL
jgi:hypothetical protein